MSVIKLDKKWKVDIRPNGRDGKRFRKTFDTKAEALRYESFIRTKHTINPDWEPPSKDRRRLADLIGSWYETRGKSLKSGSHRHRALIRICNALGNPVASKLKGTDFTEYRSERLSSGTSAGMLNHELAYLKALFNELDRSGDWNGENPVKKIRLLKTSETELSFLSKEEIENLLRLLEKTNNKDTRKVTLICLSTGARWSEAEGLKAEDVQNTKITFNDTKNNKNRSVPISRELESIIKTKSKGKLFSPCYSAFRKTIEKSDLDLPKGQLSHVLRHTFASHFMMNGGNILVLQRILGHSSLVMTMRYAHFSPEHLEEAARLNPLNSIEII